MSASISSNTLNCAFVSLNGNEFITSDIFAFLSNEIPLFFSLFPFSSNNASCIVNSSSNTNRFLACILCSISIGKCI